MSRHITKSVTDVDRVVGARICALRKAKGLSQTELGNAVGVTFQQVQKYEQGKNRVTAANLRTIAHLLEVPLVTFFDEAATDVEVGEDSPLAHLQLPGASEMLRAYAGMPLAGRQAVLSATRALAAAFPRPELVS